MKRMLALVLCVALLLCGCSGGAKNALGFSGIVKFSDMTYTRPDLTAAEALYLEALEAANGGADVDEVLDKIWDFYDAYDLCMSSYDLAYIHYQSDLSDFYWQTEYEYCAEKTPMLDLYLEELYCGLGATPLRAELEEEYFGEGWFEYYDDGGIYNEELVALMEQEQALVSEYYDHIAQAGDYDTAEGYYADHTETLADLLAELVILRQELAAWAGYDSYTDFAWDYYYERDYTVRQADGYLAAIRQELVPLYRRVNAMDVWHFAQEACDEQTVYGYVERTAKAMGGVTWEAFRLMEQAELYDISASPNKSGISFEVYLTEYYEPFIMVSGTGSRYDCLTFAHEFGHFVNDYAAAGSYAGIDVMEVFSQGMEYLSLCGTDAEYGFVEMKLADSLTVYVEQAAYAEFERKIYALPAHLVTGEKLLSVYEQVCRSYGFDSMEWDPRDMITVPHFYSNPMYIISYVVSNDAAMQFYQMELDTPGAGKTAYENSLDTEETCFMAFLSESGLQSPFDRIADVRTLLEQVFAD